jgi:hypothetical protein
MTYEPRVNAPTQGERFLGKSLAAVRETGAAGRLGISLFPRLATNTIYAISEDNPLLISKILSPGAKAAIGSGNDSNPMRAASAIFGTAAFYAGWKMAESNPKAGMVQVGDTNINLTHQVPGVGQIAAAGSAAYRIAHAVPGHESDAWAKAGKELFQSVAGMEGIAITVIGDALRQGGFGKGAAGRDVANFAGNVTKPLQPVVDLMGLIDGESNKKRDTSGSMLGPMKSHVPGLANTLPEQHVPTMSGVPETRPTYLVGLHGEQAQTPVQKEIERLGVHPPAWYPIPNTSKPQEQTAAENNKYRQLAGDQVEKQVGQLIASPQYKGMKDEQRYALVQRILTAAGKNKVLSGASPEELMSPAKRALAEAVK